MKYKYYFKKPKSEIGKDIIKWLAITGLVCFAAQSPYFSVNLIRNFKRWHKYKKRNVSDTFQRLRRQGCIKIEKEEHEIRISLTDEGKKMAGWLQIDALKIKPSKKWDKKWRIVIFDIAQLKKFYREAFRGKLKELGFYPLQKSVWIHPYNCYDEIELLRNFFGLTHKEMRLIITDDIGPCDWLRKIYKF